MTPERARGDAVRTTDHRMARHGVVKSNQVIMDFDKLTIWDSLLLAVTEARYEQPHRVFSEAAVFEGTRRRSGATSTSSASPTRPAFALSAGEKKLLDIVRCLLLKPRSSSSTSRPPAARMTSRRR